MKLNDQKLKQLGLAVIQVEAKAVAKLSEQIDDNFVKACKLLFACKGRVVVTGMGKSGHIAGKIAATLASTGTPAFFVHPGEAIHGDLGMITRQDVVMALSNSGATEEVLTLLPIIKRLDVPLIAIVGNPDSVLAQCATVSINVAVEQEACPLGLAPTSSTTAAWYKASNCSVAPTRKFALKRGSSSSALSVHMGHACATSDLQQHCQRMCARVCARVGLVPGARLVFVCVCV
jgi:arabinose-5-phosphate isomerase